MWILDVSRNPGTPAPPCSPGRNSTHSTLTGSYRDPQVDVTSRSEVHPPSATVAQNLTRLGQQPDTLAACAHVWRPWNRSLGSRTCSRAVRAEPSPGHQSSSADLLLLARELTLDAAQAARSTRITTRSLPTAQLKKLLDSRNDREILDGLRRVIAV